MSDYTNTFGGAAHDTAEDTIQGVDFDTQFDAVATMSASKANKKVPATTSNLATLSATGDLTDSLETVTTMKSYAKRGAIYLDAATTSSTISFSGTTISRTAGTIDLSVFKKGDVITITGTTLNNTSYTLASDGATASMTTTASTTAESGQVPVFTTEGVVEVLDEDDMATDSASSVPSQQSVKAYVDTQDAATLAAVPAWTLVETLTLTSKQESTAIPAGTKRIRVVVIGATRTTFNGNLNLYIGDSGGYASSIGSVTAVGTPTVYSWSSLGYAKIAASVNGATAMSGVQELELINGTYNWIIHGIITPTSGGAHLSNGTLSYANETDRIKFEASGTTFSAGTVEIWCYQ